MPATREERLARLQKCADTITQQAMDLWWEHSTQGTTACVSQLQKALPCLAELNRIYKEQPLLSWLLTCLRDKNPDVRRVAAFALGQMGEKAATADVLTALLTCLTAGTFRTPFSCRRGGANRARMNAPGLFPPLGGSRTQQALF